MKQLVGIRSWFLLIVISAPLLIMGCCPAMAQQTPRARADHARAEIAAMNDWTVGIAGGLLEGAPIRLAAEMARVADDGTDLHVLPIVTRGATENVNSLLYLRGIDAAIINSDALDEYKSQVPDIQRRITYVLNLFPSELHVFVRPEIQSLSDLVGKKVNFNTQGTAAAYSGPLIFSRLGIEVDKAFIPHQVAMEQMRRGELAAVVFITSKPVDAFIRGRWDAGFKFLPVPYESKFEDYYLPSWLDAADYPNLIRQGERVTTIAVPTVLVAFNWPIKSNRFNRVARLCRPPVLADQQTAGARFRSEMEVDQLGGDGPWPDAFSRGAGLARSSAAFEPGGAMTFTLIALVVTLAIANDLARARGAEDPMAPVRVSDRPANGAGAWIVSETTSPVDYSSIVKATLPSQGDAAMSLSIRCRGGLTEVLLDGAGLSGRREDYTLSLRINDDPPLQVSTITSVRGVALEGDVVRLLQSIPGHSELSVHVSRRTGTSAGAVFALYGIESVRAKLAATCKWPRAIAKPNN
ncbi:TRAP-type uncharacterized transport system substrate-binding protein [Bradyrhizobium sp. USDA 3686]